MPWSAVDILLALPVFALVLFRVTGLLLTAPIFASTVIPARIRVAIGATAAAMIFPLVGTQAPKGLTMSMALVGGAGALLSREHDSVAAAVPVDRQESLSVERKRMCDWGMSITHEVIDGNVCRFL